MANRLNGPALTYERASGTGAEKRKRIVDIHMARVQAGRRRETPLAQADHFTYRTPWTSTAVYWLAFAMAISVPVALTLLPVLAPHH